MGEQSGSGRLGSKKPEGSQVFAPPPALVASAPKARLSEISITKDAQKQVSTDLTKQNIRLDISKRDDLFGSKTPQEFATKLHVLGLSLEETKRLTVFYFTATNRDIPLPVRDGFVEEFKKGNLKTIRDMEIFMSSRGYQKEFESIRESVNYSLEAIISSGKDAFLDMRNLLGDQFRDTLQKLWEKLEDGKEKDAKSELTDAGVKDADGIVMTTKDAIEAGAEKDEFIREVSEQTKSSVTKSKPVRPE